MKKVDWGWQGKAKTLQERGDYLLKNYPIPADITFEFADDDTVIVDDGAVPVKKTIAAHKFILALGSEVFHAMFYGPAADAALARVPIPNYSHATFEKLITFLYTDKCSQPSRRAEAMETLRCALQYGVPHLAMICRPMVIDFLQHYVWGRPAELWDLLVKARTLEEKEIEQETLRVLDGHAVSVLQSLPGCNVSKELLEEYIRRSELKLEDEEEVEVYRAVRKWEADKQLSSGKKATASAKTPPRRPLGAMYSHVRFLLMTPAQLAEGPVKDRVFSGEQVSQLFEKKFSTAEKFRSPLTIISVFSTKRRSSRIALELGQISIEASWKFSTGKVTKEKQAYTFCIVPDKSACPATAQRFLSLCRKGYHFSIVWHSSEIIGGTQPQVTVASNLVFYRPLPTENKLSHDSGGTVALRIGVLPGGSSIFQLIISPDEHKEKDLGGAVVFGRLQHWDKDFGAFRALSTFATELPLMSNQIQWTVKSSLVEEDPYDD